MLQMEKTMMNGYNHKNRPVMRLPKEEVKKRRASSTLMFGTTGATKGVGERYEPHIAPTHPICYWGEMNIANKS